MMCTHCLCCNPGQWSSPSMKGSRPPPCYSFSLTMIDEDQAVMFGGFTPPGESSEAHVLHLPTMVSWNVRELVKSISREGKLVQAIACSYLRQIPLLTLYLIY